MVMMLKLGDTHTDTNEDTDNDTHRDGEDSSDDNDKYYHIDKHDEAERTEITR